MTQLEPIKHADPADTASELEQSFTDDSIRAVSNRVPVGPAENDICECGESIPTKRKMAGYSNCVDCQTRLEILPRVMRLKK